MARIRPGRLYPPCAPCLAGSWGWGPSEPVSLGRFGCLPQASISRVVLAEAWTSCKEGASCSLAGPGRAEVLMVGCVGHSSGGVQRQRGPTGVLGALCSAFGPPGKGLLPPSPQQSYTWPLGSQRLLLKRTPE